MIPPAPSGGTRKARATAAAGLAGRRAGKALGAWQARQEWALPA
jgi:hypothetical protein